MNRSMKKIIQKCDLVILPENGPNEGNITKSWANSKKHYTNKG